MSRIIQVHREVEKLKRSGDADLLLVAALRTDLEDAIAGRSNLERTWREAMRLYEAIPRAEIKNTPIENAPNLEIPFTMMGVDIFYSVSLQTIFNISPLVTTSPIPGRSDQQSASEALQDWTNYITRNELKIREASNHTFMDDIVLGTGVFTIPWIMSRRKTKVNTITYQRPEVHPWPLEDVIVRGGLHQNFQNIPMVHLRTYYTKQEIEAVARVNNLEIEKISPTGSIGWVRSRREQMAKSETGVLKDGLYEIIQSYVYFDYDNDGWEEDLLVTWDRVSGTLLSVIYNPYDHRPLEVMRYHPRAFMFYGQGMPEKLRALQTEMSDIHNQRILNIILANSRMWARKASSGLPDQFSVFPGKVLTVNNADDLTPLQMGEVYPSIERAEGGALQLASQLIGLNEMNPAQSNLFSSRTPATTAQLGSSLQNQRFGSSFDSMKSATSGSVIQALYRYQERLLAGDKNVENHIRKIMGEQADLVITTLKDREFDENINVELTATSNRQTPEAKVQTLMQMSDIFNKYYDSSLKIAEMVSNPQVPNTMREMAGKVHRAMTETMERVARNIDTIRDPETFLVRLAENINDAADVADAGALSTVGTLLQQMQRVEEGLGDGQNIDTFQ